MEKREDIIEFEKTETRKQKEDDGTLESSVSELKDDALEHEIVQMTPKKHKKMTKNDQAKKLIKDAQELVHKADDEVDLAKETLAKSIDRFEALKIEMLNTTMAHNTDLLKKANFEHQKYESDEPFEVSLESTTEKFSLDKVTSGRFTGLILAILGIIAAVAAWVFVASYKTGTKINLDQLLDEATQNTLLTWIGGGITGGQGDPLFGVVAVVVTALLVGWAIYKLRLSMRENRNFKVASRTFEKSHGYVENQKKIKTEMERLDEHLNAATTLMLDYKVLLEELNAKLQRILHIEGALERQSDYHTSSQQVMKDSDKLMNRIEVLLSTPMTKEGKLNKASEDALNEAKLLYESFVSKLYNS